MSPIKILRVHQRPPGQDQLLREIAGKLTQFLSPLGDVLSEPVADRCIGCGRVGIFVCRHCDEFMRAVDKKKLEQSQKLMSTVEQRFAAQHFE
jgi:hypothetical protein